MNMKTQFKSILAASTMLVVACAPSIYGIQVETRQPSASGLDLTGKSVAVIYPEGLGEKEDALNRSFVSSLVIIYSSCISGKRFRSACQKAIPS